MPLREYKPLTAGRRFATVSDFADITKDKPEKSLVRALKKTGGRNNQGRVTCRHIGGGNKRQYRIIDFKRDRADVPAKVAAIEYDPNRNARIALLMYKDGERRYIIQPLGLNVGDEVMSGENAEPRLGNHMPLNKIPTGMEIHNIELEPKKGGQVVHSAGSFAVLMSKEGKYAHVQLPSMEIRKFNLDCCATIGRIGNIDANLVWLGKAGRKRWLGIKPTVRGTAKNPVDHPMGGGEGRKGGGRHPCSRTGVLSKGGKTRKDKKPSSGLIIRHRKRGRFQF